MLSFSLRSSFYFLREQSVEEILQQQLKTGFLEETRFLHNINLIAADGQKCKEKFIQRISFIGVACQRKWRHASMFIMTMIRKCLRLLPMGYRFPTFPKVPRLEHTSFSSQVKKCKLLFSHFRTEMICSTTWSENGKLSKLLRFYFNCAVAVTFANEFEMFESIGMLQHFP